MKLKTLLSLLIVAFVVLETRVEAALNYAFLFKFPSEIYVGPNNGASDDVIIDSSYSDIPVTHIADAAFSGSPGMTSITIPSTVIRIGSDHLNQIGELPTQYQFTDGSSFANCSGLSTLSIPDSVKYIGQYSFYGCTGLSHVSLPTPNPSDSNSRVDIYRFAFGNCINLSSVSLPNKVFVDPRAFTGCSSLTSFNLAGSNTWYSTIDGVLFDKTATSLLIFPPSYFSSSLITTAYNVPSGVQNISDYAFYLCTKLAFVELPDTLTNISSSAFYGCSNLMNVTFGNGVRRIGTEAFKACVNLRTLSIPASVTNIGTSAFANCINLTEIVFFGNAPTLGAGAFTEVNTNTATVYYIAGTSGWGPTYGGLRTAPFFYLPQVVIKDVRVEFGNFAFTFTGNPGQAVVLEASTNLLDWQAVLTNTLSGTNGTFSDPGWMNYRSRFFRAR